MSQRRRNAQQKDSKRQKVNTHRTKAEHAVHYRQGMQQY